jgi:hypothetical protein
VPRRRVRDIRSRFHFKNYKESSVKKLRVFAIAVLAAIALIAAPNQPTASKVKAATTPTTTCSPVLKGHTVAGDRSTCAGDGLVIFESGDHYDNSWNGSLCPLCGATLIYGHTQAGGKASSLATGAATTTLRVASEASEVRLRARPTCGAFVDGHTQAGGSPQLECSDDGKPIFPADNHIFKPGLYTNCPYDSAALVNGHSVPGN